MEVRSIKFKNLIHFRFNQKILTNNNLTKNLKFPNLKIQLNSKTKPNKTLIN